MVDQHGGPYAVADGVVYECVIPVKDHDGNLPKNPGWVTGDPRPDKDHTWHLPRFTDPTGGVIGTQIPEKQHWKIEVPDPKKPGKMKLVKLLDPRPHELVPNANGEGMGRNLPEKY